MVIGDEFLSGEFLLNSWRLSRLSPWPVTPVPKISTLRRKA